MRQPPSLADRVLAALPGFTEAPLARDMAARLNTDEPHVKQAFDRLEKEGRAKIVRRGRGLHLVPADYPGRLCIICRAEFTATRKETVACSYSCARHLAWRNQDMRKRHRASVTASHARPEVKEKLTTRSREYWSDQASREQASEIQREKWQDTNIRGRRMVGLEAAWSSPERREKQKDRRLKDWQNPEFREKTVAAMRNGKRGVIKRRAIELATANPSMTVVEIAGRLNCKVVRIDFILRRARKEGVIGIRPGDGPRLRKRLQEEAA
ncbi:MAG: hypothetical protein EOS65_02530 [Mesorhizobium sp.]|uniref:hypothetical protein n=1 Tax=Mesorhizobium sp. TaxID=1871066 RepID=UPI000FE64A31|nr:hypothetical protein [Mesorhizobium sp.]RWF44271.1 MAG: hypothetical protein EOS65_02530 [Mesorhizobium sp.]